jgi:diketogulonate reductase-like aldo/keto reductase
LNSRGQHPKAVEADALRTRLSHGMRLIDTAEMYGDGDSENLINAVIAGQRDQAFLVSKVLPHHASGDGIARACGAVSPASAPIISISICCTGGMPRLTCQG